MQKQQVKMGKWKVDEMLFAYDGFIKEEQKQTYSELKDVAEKYLRKFKLDEEFSN